MTEKHCRLCDTTKPIDDFYATAKGGPDCRCKECVKAYMRSHYRKVKPQKQAYERKRFQDPQRKAKQLEYQRRRRKNNPDKYAAWNAVSNAIRDGRLIREPCEVCGKKAQAHHDDYSKPLDVLWLCFKHHREVHGQEVT